MLQKIYKARKGNLVMTEIHEIVKTYRTDQRLSLREFADEINRNLVNTGVTYGTVNRWESEDQPYEPDMRLLFECIATYSDWRAEWAADCLKAMWPELFLSGVVRLKLPVAE